MTEERWALVKGETYCTVCNMNYSDRGSEMCSSCLDKIHERGTSPLLVQPLRIANDTGGVPDAIVTDGGFRCLICEGANYSGKLICGACKDAVLAIKDMRSKV